MIIIILAAVAAAALEKILVDIEYICACRRDARDNNNI